MKLTLLGTGAAYGVPALYCDCPVCENARRVGGREVRTTSGALIDSALKIDFPPDTLRHTILYHLDFSRLYHLLITHTHQDHFAVYDIAHRNGVYSALPEDAPPMHVYGNADVADKMHEAAAKAKPNRLSIHEVAPFQPFDAGEYRVTPTQADHMKGNCLNYLIEHGEKSLFYGLDSDVLPEETMAFLKGKEIDLFVLDCTFGLMARTFPGHMTLAECRALKARLLETGAAREGATFVLSHMSSASTHAALVEAAPDFVVAYDGMELDV